METYVAEGITLTGIRQTLENALRMNYSIGIIKKKELDRNMNKVMNHLIPELCSKYSMSEAVSKLEEIRNDVECGCSFDNCYIRAIDPERVRKINDRLSESAALALMASLSIQRKEDLQDRNYIAESVSENCMKVLENC
jgi:hypothetical protein